MLLGLSGSIRNLPTFVPGWIITVITLIFLPKKNQVKDTTSFSVAQLVKEFPLNISVSRTILYLFDKVLTLKNILNHTEVMKSRR